MQIASLRASGGRWIALLLLLVTAPLAIAADSWSRDDAAHLLRRAGFGGTPQQIDALHAMGRAAAVDYLITGKPNAPVEAVFKPVAFPSFETTKVDKDASTDRKELVKQIQRAGRQDLVRYRGYWVDRMIRTDRPLEEKMTLFWHGLLCSGVQEVKSGTFLVEQNKLFHQHALGNYKELIAAIVHDPAMLRYLDADRNVVGKPNENLARELMELFTMGEGQGYTEKDIAEVARALTGMGVQGRDGEALFRVRAHDNRLKTIFGKSGNFRPDDVPNLIFERPQPPQYLARKLWEFFAYPNPTSQDLAPVVQALRQSKFELKPALKALFTSPAFYGEKAKFALIQSPTELCVSTARLLEQTPNATALASQLGKMGQELFQPPNVKGWPGGEQWITAATLFNRYNTCTAMVEGKQAPAPNPRGITRRFEGGRALTTSNAASPEKLFPQFDAKATAGQLVDAAIARFLQRPLHPDKRTTLINSLGDAPIQIGRPESDRRIRQMLSLLLSTPEYQVH